LYENPTLNLFGNGIDTCLARVLPGLRGQTVCAARAYAVKPRNRQISKIQMATHLGLHDNRSTP
jgi:hypothetical protein